jgi:hypothetical protein
MRARGMMKMVKRVLWECKRYGGMKKSEEKTYLLLLLLHWIAVLRTTREEEMRRSKREALAKVCFPPFTPLTLLLHLLAILPYFETDLFGI